MNNIPWKQHENITPQIHLENTANTIYHENKIKWMKIPQKCNIYYEKIMIIIMNNSDSP